MTKYPFTEGEHYFTIEDNTIVESIWDEQSEELYTDKKMYFITQLEAFYYYRFIRTDEMLHSAVHFIKSNENSFDFLDGYSYFNSIPKINKL